MRRFKPLFTTLMFCFPLLTEATDNVVLITLDGMRWQEVFQGIDPELATHDEYASQSEEIMARFWRESPAERAEVLMPFLHRVVFRQGTYVGNRNADSCARVANPWYFSYPGYSEILSGVVNPDIDSNRKTANPEKTFLELLNNKPEFRGRMAAFTSWDVFPYIFNVERSGLFINAFDKTPAPINEFELFLNRVIDDMPPRWPTVRNDVFTHHFALSYMREKHPRVVYISYGETDDFAHEGLYDEYVMAANRSDRFIAEVWDRVQSSAFYRDNTILFITTDHGRGEEPVETWLHHASKQSLRGYMQSLAQYEEGIVGSEAVWMAAIGPGIPASGLVETGVDCLTSDRIAATLLEHLGMDYRIFNPDMGMPMAEFLP
jgi:hypothetical protein